MRRDRPTRSAGGSCARAPTGFAHDPERRRATGCPCSRGAERREPLAARAVVEVARTIDLEARNALRWYEGGVRVATIPNCGPRSPLAETSAGPRGLRRGRWVSPIADDGRGLAPAEPTLEILRPGPAGARAHGDLGRRHPRVRDGLSTGRPPVNAAATAGACSASARRPVTIRSTTVATGHYLPSGYVARAAPCPVAAEARRPGRRQPGRRIVQEHHTRHERHERPQPSAPSSPRRASSGSRSRWERVPARVERRPDRGPRAASARSARHAPPGPSPAPRPRRAADRAASTVARPCQARPTLPWPPSPDRAGPRSRTPRARGPCPAPGRLVFVARIVLFSDPNTPGPS